jgi:hypothetical protein
MGNPRSYAPDSDRQNTRSENYSQVFVPDRENDVLALRDYAKTVLYSDFCRQLMWFYNHESSSISALNILRIRALENLDDLCHLAVAVQSSASIAC